MADSPTSGGGERGAMIDPSTLMAIRNLELRARSVVEGFWSGIHRSPYHGFSVEFTEYRSYSPGDDLRYLDWKLLARSDRLYIKKFEDETNLRCHLLTDNSRSMLFGSGSYTKADYANTLAATLAYFLYQQGDGIGLMKFDEQVREYLPARHRHGHLRHIMHALEREPEGAATDLGSPVRKIAELMRRRGLVVLLTDLLAPIDELERDLALLTSVGHEVMLFQLLDPAELDFKFDASAQFVDLETGEELFIDPAQARDDYRRRFNEHMEAAELVCRKLGITFRRFTIDQPLELALYDFLKARLQSGRIVRRNTSKAA